MRVTRVRRAGAGMIVGCLLAAIGLCAPVSPARADGTEQSILMDDYAFIYSSPAKVEQNLQQVASLGVNTIKVSMVWSLIAPDPDSTTEPTFDATNPAAYPAGNWQRYDTLVQDADQLGLKVYFQLTGPAPLWATNPDVTGHEHNWSHDVNATDFGQFVQAVGDRYSGSYPVSGDGDSSTATTTTTSTTPTTTTTGLLGVLGGSPSSGSANSGTGSGTLPAVTEWGIWNEPNEIGWLSPQTEDVDGRTVAESPILERALIDSAYSALQASGHGLDTILIGETASEGTTHELSFVDDLYCVNASDKPLRGEAATLEGCPGNSASFVEDNPGLFHASGYATHPYGFSIPPDQTFKHSPSTITLANLGVLERGLDRIDVAYGQPTGMPIYVTEWGYKTDPPNPTVTTSLAEQETWLDEGWYMTSEMPRVKSMAQELLYDQPPIAGKVPGSAAYWANFDSGLEYEDGSPKPAYAAFRLPLWLPSQKTGGHVALWAEIRPAGVAKNATAELQFAAPRASAWSDVEPLTTTNPDGFLSTHVSLPHAGSIRLAWNDPATQTTYYSRTVTIR